MHGARHVNLALDECDLLLVAGARFDDRATGKIEEFCPRAGVVHIDIDASELGKIRRPSVGVRGDVGEALRRMMPHLRPDERAPWHGRIAELRRMHPCSMSEDACPDTPWGLVREIAGLAGEDAIVATDVGQHQMWVAQAYPFTRPRSWLTSGGLGTMGFGLPAAIGAALACPDRHVVCFTGDGSLLMNMQELATAVEEDVNVKIVLMNNGTLGLVRQQQTLFYGNRLFGSTFRHTVDFPSLARSLGMPALDLGESDAGCAVEDLRTAFGSRGPCLINIPVDADHHVVPMVPPGAANRDMIGGGRGCAA
jgi:acetolactate synthase-1/2/3 large subunit